MIKVWNGLFIVLFLQEERDPEYHSHCSNKRANRNVRDVTKLFKKIKGVYIYITSRENEKKDQEYFCYSLIRKENNTEWNKNNKRWLKYTRNFKI